MITIKQITAAWREQRLPECAKKHRTSCSEYQIRKDGVFLPLLPGETPKAFLAQLPGTMPAPLLQKLVFWPSVGTVKLVNQNVLLSILRWVLGFSKLPLYLPWQQPTESPGKRNLFSISASQLQTSLPPPLPFTSLPQGHFHPLTLPNLLLLSSISCFIIQVTVCRKEYESTLCVRYGGRRKLLRTIHQKKMCFTTPCHLSVWSDQWRWVESAAWRGLRCPAWLNKTGHQNTRENKWKM